MPSRQHRAYRESSFQARRRRSPSNVPPSYHSHHHGGSRRSRTRSRSRSRSRSLGHPHHHQMNFNSRRVQPLPHPDSRYHPSGAVGAGGGGGGIGGMIPSGGYRHSLGGGSAGGSGGGPPASHYGRGATNNMNEGGVDGEPLLTFREYMLTLPDDDNDPQLAVEKYSKYKEAQTSKFAVKFFAEHKETGHMLENYHPDYVHAQHLTRRKDCRRIASAFFKQLSEGSLKEIKFVASGKEYLKNESSSTAAFSQRETSIAIENPEAAQRSTGGVPPYFITDPNANSLRLSQIPLAISSWNVISLLTNEQTNGVEDVTLLPPTQSDPYSRDGWIKFDSKQHCIDAASALYKVKCVPTCKCQRVTAAGQQTKTECSGDCRPKETYTLHPVVEHAKKNVMSQVTPAVMCRPDRIRRDVALSSEIIRKFDREYGIDELLKNDGKEENIDAEHSEKKEDMGVESGCFHPLVDRLKSEDCTVVDTTLAEEEMQLDLQILYLRRVHNVCYYSGKRFASHRELWEKACPLVVRPFVPAVLDVEAAGSGEAVEGETAIDEAVGGSNAEKHNDWVKSLDSKLDALLKTEFPPHDPITENEPQVATRWQAYCSEKTSKVDDGRWRCIICIKLFRGPEFVHKHLKNKHGEALKEIMKQVSDEYMESAYLKDPEKHFVVARRTSQTGGHHADSARGGPRAHGGHPMARRQQRSQERVDENFEGGYPYPREDMPYRHSPMMMGGHMRRRGSNSPPAGHRDTWHHDEKWNGGGVDDDHHPVPLDRLKTHTDHMEGGPYRRRQSDVFCDRDNPRGLFGPGGPGGPQMQGQIRAMIRYDDLM